MTLLNCFSDGPTHYRELIDLGLPPAWVEIQLRKLKKAGAIVMDAQGRYCPPTKPPADDDDLSVLSVYQRTYYSQNRMKLLAGKKAARDKNEKREIIWCKGCKTERKAINFARRERCYLHPLCYPCKNRNRYAPAKRYKTKAA